MNISQKNLPCGHTICSICILNLIQQENIVRCPFDRSEYDKNSYFPNAETILDMINSAKNDQNLNKQTNEKDMMMEQIRKLMYNEIKSELDGTSFIVESKENDNHIMNISVNICIGLKTNFQNFYFSSKVFLLSKMKNYTMDSIDYNPSSNLLYVSAYYEDSNWICYSYALLFDKNERRFNYKQPSDFYFKTGEIKDIISEEIMKAMYNRDYFNLEESNKLVKLLLKLSSQKLQEFLLKDYSFSIECLFKSKKEGFALGKECDNVMQGLEGTTWIIPEGNLNSNAYSFFIFVSIFKNNNL